MEPSAVVPVDVGANAGREVAEPRALRAVMTLVLLAATASVYSAAVFGPPFFTKGEPREAVVTQRMLAQRDFVLPRRTPSEIPAKPPLFHWLGAASSVAAGRVSEATVRVPSIAASLLTVALTATAGYRAFGTSAGIVAAVVLATSQQWIASSVTARVDMVLAAAITVSMLAFLGARLAHAPFPVLFWVGCALAVLAKGPVGYVLAPLVVVAFLLVRRDLGYLRTIRLGPALGILAIPLCWYAAAWQRGGDEFLEKVVAENFYRMIDADAGDVGHRHSTLYYVPALLAGMAPWSVLLVPASVELWRRRTALLDDSRLLAVTWSAATVLFYSLAESKRAVYLLPCYPALALLIGDWLARRFNDERRTTPSSRVVVWSARALSVVIAVAGALVALQSLGVPTFELLGPVLSPGDQANLGPLARAVQRRALAIHVWLATILALAAVLERSTRAGAWRAAVAAVALMVASTTAFASATLLRDLARSQSIREFIESAASRLPERHVLYFYAASRDGRDLYFFRSFEYAASFYAGRPLEVVYDLEGAGNGAVVWFLTADSTFGRLRRAARSARDGLPRYRFVERGRYTYGDNPRRTPIVLVEARRRHR